MLKLSDMARVGRPVRQDGPDELGIPTPNLIADAIDGERFDDAKALAEYGIAEGKSLHDLFCDWIWNLLTDLADRHGEEEVGRVLRATQGGWMLRRTWKAFLSMSVEARVQLSAEMMRAHLCGPEQDGAIEVTEDSEKYTIVMDPCGSGGRMRRGDPVDGTPSRLDRPYGFGVTRDAHDWAFGERGVPYYCAHCAINEKLPMEWGGHPLWVTDYQADAKKPCAWRFYKSAEDIPEHYYRRAGHAKPPAGHGEY
jgi:hypothetical protein